MRKLFVSLCCVPVVLFCLCRLFDVWAQPVSSSEIHRLLDDENPFKQTFAIYQVGMNKIAAREKIIRLASHDNLWVRRAAVFSLGLSPEESMIPVFEKALKDVNYGVRRAAVIALGNTESPKTAALLEKALKDNDYGVREFAAIAIGMRGMKNCVPSLIESLDDPSIRVRRTAVKALGALGDSSAIEPLRSLFKDIREGKIAKPDESAVRVRLNRQGSYPFGFIYFQEIIEQFAESSGIDIRINDEVIYGIYAVAQDADNLDSIKVNFYHTPTNEALKRITNVAGAYFYIESGTINIAGKSYIRFDTELDFETAAALYVLGDRSGIDTIRKYRNAPLYKDRVQELLK